MPPPIPVTAVHTSPGDPGYQALLGWSFAAPTFYEAQVPRLLRNDIPQRVMYSSGLVWTYWTASGDTVGFGSLDICSEYAQFTGGKPHCYIPLLAVNPGFRKQGHGRSIVEHLVSEAAALRRQSSAGISDFLFLDVYTANQGAISLYAKCGFVVLNPNTPVPDPEENNETYVIMAKAIATRSP